MTNGLSIMDVVVPQRHLQGVQRQVVRGWSAVCQPMIRREPMRET